MPTKRTHKKIPARKKTAARPAGTTDPRPLVEGEGRRKEGAVMGADVGKDALDYCIVTGEDILARGQRPNAKDSIEDIISIARKRHVVSVGVESTGTYHWKLVYALVDAGIPVLLANPRQTKNVQGKKTDPLDGLRIAAAHRDGRLLPSVVPARDVVEVRRATRAIVRCTNERTKCLQRVNAIFADLDFPFPALAKSAKGVRALLAALSGDDISQVMQERFGRQAKLPAKVPSLGELAAALESLASSASLATKAVLASELESVEHFKRKAKVYRAVYYDLAQRNAAFCHMLELLLSVEGIGPDLAAAAAAKIADIQYFPSPDALTKWAGLVPKVHQTGRNKHVTGRLHKAGNKYLRRALCMATTAIYMRCERTGADHPVYHLAKRVYQKTGYYWKGICAGARKLLATLWFMLARDQAWAPPDVVDAQLAKRVQRVYASKLALFQRKVATVERALNRLQVAFPDSYDDPEGGPSTDGGGVAAGCLARGYSKKDVKALLQELFQQA